jgi:N-acetylmuramoyl-L-alanine amidase
MNMKYALTFIGILAVILAYLYDSKQEPVTAASANSENIHIVLDAGHGGTDNGAVVENVSEARINLEIVRALEIELTARKFIVSLTRTDSESLASPYSANKKVDDMAKRREKIRKLSPDLVISIHQNTFPSPAVYGLQCFYASETTGSLQYAEAIQKQFNDSGLITYRNVRRTDFNLCEHSPVPAVLIECGFLSNSRERKLLTTPEYQGILAYNIAVAVTNFFNANIMN